VIGLAHLCTKIALPEGSGGIEVTGPECGMGNAHDEISAFQSKE
jgi:hypothetical protein